MHLPKAKLQHMGHFVLALVTSDMGMFRIRAWLATGYRWWTAPTKVMAMMAVMALTTANAVALMSKYQQI